MKAEGEPGVHPDRVAIEGTCGGGLPVVRSEPTSAPEEALLPGSATTDLLQGGEEP